jgi:hypothetical protein
LTPVIYLRILDRYPGKTSGDNAIGATGANGDCGYERKFTEKRRTKERTMIKIPFKREDFAKEMKPLISGMNLSLEYDNIESSLCKVAVDITNIIPKGLYERLIKKFEKNAGEPYKTAVNYLQRAMLHFSLYEHLIFIITRVSSDGVTVKKNDDETTAYKYLTDELNNKLISTAWFWMNQLIQLLNREINNFPEWTKSEEKKAFDELPVGLSDFNKWVGVASTGGEYFMMCAGWIIREVWLDCVCSRYKEPIYSSFIARSVCYEVMGRACQMLAYSCLPEPIRKDIDNEMGKNHRAQADKDIREHVAGKFLSKAETYWNAVDLEIKKAEIAAQKKTMASQPILGERNLSESDKFCYL